MLGRSASIILFASMAAPPCSWLSAQEESRGQESSGGVVGAHFLYQGSTLSAQGVLRVYVQLEPSGNKPIEYWGSEHGGFVVRKRELVGGDWVDRRLVVRDYYPREDPELGWRRVERGYGPVFSTYFSKGIAAMQLVASFRTPGEGPVEESVTITDSDLQRCNVREMFGGMDLEGRDRELMIEAWRGSVADADVDRAARVRTPDGITPLHIAAALGHVGLCRELVSHGANPNAGAGQFSTPPLAFAVIGGRLDVARCLLWLGADPAQLGDSETMSIRDRARAIKDDDIRGRMTHLLRLKAM